MCRQPTNLRTDAWYLYLLIETSCLNSTAHETYTD